MTVRAAIDAGEPGHPDCGRPAWLSGAPGAGPAVSDRGRSHAYLSSNVKELRNRDKDDAELHARSRDRWYVPDPNKAGDLEKLSEGCLA